MRIVFAGSLNLSLIDDDGNDVYHLEADNVKCDINVGQMVDMIQDIQNQFMEALLKAEDNMAAFAQRDELAERRDRTPA